MYKTRFAILVGLLMALLFLCSMDAEAATTDVDNAILNVNFNNWYGYVPLDFTTQSTDGDETIMTYRGLYSGYIELWRSDDVIYNYVDGYYEIPLTFDVRNSDTTTNNVALFVNIVDVQAPDNCTVSFRYLSRDSEQTTIMLKLAFNQFDISPHYGINITFDMSSLNTIATTDFTNAQKRLYFGVSYGESTSRLEFYSGWENMPGMSDFIGSRLNNISNMVSYMASNFNLTLADWKNSLDAKLDEVIQKLSFNYDPEQGNATNSELSSSLDSWEAAEGATMSDAKIDVSNYDTSTVFNFAPALVSSLSLVTTFATGFLRASGDFTTAISVMFSLAFVSVLVGLVRFVRG